MYDANPEETVYDHDINLARKMAQEAPEIRQDRVAEIKYALHSGSYRPNADILAAQLLSDPFHQVNYDL